ncbi:MAG: sodium:proton antiporter [Lachnospiraceae bacterium]|nr:sodium:proton antiporter [Lachnospiraceae bacterium]
MTIPELSGYLFGGAIIVLILIMFACLIRAIRGPEIADRIVAVNMLGTLTIMVICILSLWQKESYLLDVALIYAMISFLAVVVLTRVYLGVHREHLEARNRRENIIDGFGTDENGEAPAAPAAGGEGGER